MASHTRVRGVSIVLMLVGAVATVCASVPAQGVLPAIPGLVDRFLAPEHAPLVSYRAFRRLTASTRGGRMEAAIEAWTSLAPKVGFTFQVTAEEGSATIRQRVLIPVLEAEQKAMKGASAQHMALTRDNYDFLAISDDRDNLMKVDIKPRHKHAMLINGSVFLAGDTADLVRVEGEPSERPSFWTRHVRIVREYARVLGVRVPVAMSSTADVLIGGSSNFTMTYRYTDINGAAVDGR
jgi:hypothetical protein